MEWIRFLYIYTNWICPKQRGLLFVVLMLQDVASILCEHNYVNQNYILSAAFNQWHVEVWKSLFLTEYLQAQLHDRLLNEYGFERWLYLHYVKWHRLNEKTEKFTTNPRAKCYPKNITFQTMTIAIFSFMFIEKKETLNTLSSRDRGFDISLWHIGFRIINQ